MKKYHRHQRVTAHQAEPGPSRATATPTLIPASHGPESTVLITNPRATRKRKHQAIASTSSPGPRKRHRESPTQSKAATIHTKRREDEHGDPDCDGALRSPNALLTPLTGIAFQTLARKPAKTSDVSQSRSSPIWTQSRTPQTPNASGCSSSKKCAMSHRNWRHRPPSPGWARLGGSLTQTTQAGHSRNPRFALPQCGRRSRGRGRT